MNDTQLLKMVQSEYFLKNEPCFAPLGLNEQGKTFPKGFEHQTVRLRKPPSMSQMKIVSKVALA